jgi:hypothetical protein
MTNYDYLTKKYMAGKAIPVNIGDRFGKLTVINPNIGHDNQNSIMVELKCDCGKTRITRRANLHSKKVEACQECYLEVRSEKNKIHGQRYSLAYRRWTAMKQRCNDPYHPSYEYYKDRGYDESWEKFEPFYEELGDCPEDFTLERIDNSKPYGPGNCKWATRTEQNQNKSDTKIKNIEQANLIREKYKTGTYTYSDLADEYGCSTGAIGRIIRNIGWKN